MNEIITRYFVKGYDRPFSTPEAAKAFAEKRAGLSLLGAMQTARRGQQLAAMEIKHKSLFLKQAKECTSEELARIWRVEYIQEALRLRSDGDDGKVWLKLGCVRLGAQEAWKQAALTGRPLDKRELELLRTVLRFFLPKEIARIAENIKVSKASLKQSMRELDRLQKIEKQRRQEHDS